MAARAATVTSQLVRGEIRARSHSLRELVHTAGGPALVLATMLDAAGTGLIAPLTILYFVVGVRLPVGLVGTGMTIGGAIALMAAPLGGHFVDRAGSRRALLVGWSAAGIAVAGYALVRSWPELIVAVSALGIATSVGGTARSTLLSALVAPGDIARVMALVRAFRNVGYGVGGLLATAALAAGHQGFLFAIYGDAASFLLGAALVLAAGRRLRSVSGDSAQPGRAPKGLGGSGGRPVTLRTVLTDRRFVTLGLLDGLTSFHQVALQVALPLWVVLFTHAPRELVGLLYTLNTALVVLAQVRVARGVRVLAQAPRALLYTAIAMAGAGAAFLGAHYAGAVAATVLLVAGAMLMTAAEMFASAANWIVTYALADPEHRGKYLSVYSMGAGLGRAAGPSVTAALASAGALPLWPVIAAIVAAGALPTAAIARAAQGAVSGSAAGEL